MPQPINLRLAFMLPPEKAVEYFQSKGYMITWSWKDAAREAHDMAFTVAKATNMDVLITIRDELQRAIDGKLTMRDFIRDLAPRLQDLGWWGRDTASNVSPGRPDLVDTGTGEVQTVQLGSPGRLRTIYRTNLQTSYMAGRYQQMMDNVKLRPWWQYVAVMDARTRPDHAALNGLIFRYDDPFWDYFYPPWAFNCRCVVRALSDDDMQVKGLQPTSSEGKLSVTDQTDADSGVTAPVAQLDLGGKVIQPGFGWSYSRGRTPDAGAQLALQEKSAELGIKP